MFKTAYIESVTNISSRVHKTQYSIAFQYKVIMGVFCITGLGHGVW